MASLQTDELKAKLALAEEHNRGLNAVAANPADNADLSRQLQASLHAEARLVKELRALRVELKCGSDPVDSERNGYYFP